MVNDNDLAAAVVIALAILLIFLCVWPGAARIRPHDLAGFWGSASGSLHVILALPGRAFRVTSGGPATPPDTPSARLGRVCGLRGVRISRADPAHGGDLPELAGSVELGGRRIHWRDGDIWHRQGVK